ncbi:hypothetical protein [Engelhardtia mirabilis]|uniref:hypothetical protein n=1 Tax=Engelhardtia mirabilis TaxID=2528011 RepID=UPI003AF3F345
MMAPTVRQETRRNFETIVLLHCCARNAVRYSKLRVKLLLGSAQDICSVFTPRQDSQ